MKTKELIWYAVDLDGTLADTQPPTFSLKKAEPIKANVDKLKEVVEEGFKIMIHTSRHWDDFQEVESWLRKWDIPFKSIWCGKPLVHKYIDDKAVWSEESSWL